MRVLGRLMCADCTARDPPDDRQSPFRASSHEHMRPTRACKARNLKARSPPTEAAQRSCPFFEGGVTLVMMQPTPAPHQHPPRPVHTMMRPTPRVNFGASFVGGEAVAVRGTLTRLTPV